MAIKDIASIVGVLVAVGLGVYNVWRTWKVAHMFDSLLLDDKRFEALRTAIDILTLRTKERTSLVKACLGIRVKMIELSDSHRSELQKLIDQADKKTEDLGKDIASDRDYVESARELTAPTTPIPELIMRVNRVLGQMKTRHSDALLEQANTDAFLLLFEVQLATAQLLLDSTR